MAEALYGLIHDDPSITLVSPDDGASKKTEALQHYMMMRKSWRLRIIQCKKKRDPVSGKLTDFIISDGNPMKRHCVIVDDICDGGGTFLGLDKVLKEAGASKTSLLVTHGLFTQGTEKLTKVFDNVICTDSVFKTNSKGVRVLRELHL
jgi:ribose-phosphate pyrophosphokinase